MSRRTEPRPGIPAFLIPPQVKRDFAPVRARVRAAVDASPKTVTLEAALAQVERFRKASQ